MECNGGQEGSVALGNAVIRLARRYSEQIKHLSELKPPYGDARVADVPHSVLSESPPTYPTQEPKHRDEILDNRKGDRHRSGLTIAIYWATRDDPA